MTPTPALELGAFVTPAAARAREVVGLVQHAEAVGLDLVAVQDHPYQPAFLDTWTLLSHLGAATQRIHLAPDVVNLPLRPPAVLARAAASLDLLTGGRVALGIGAGAFWDAIVAMGGRRLDPPEAVRSVEQAIGILRGIWAVEERAPLRVEGDVHHVRGVKRGPAPAHPIPIWVGAYGPRMTALTGRLADGWLPSLGRLPEGGLARGNRILDDAATDAGRDPDAVRRLLNIGAEHLDVSLLADLSLEHRVRTFIVASDDPAVLERFARDVGPQLRERVERET